MGVNSGYKESNVIFKYFDNTYFKEFFDLNDANVLQWALTVMEKVYDKGIVPSYVDRNSGNDNLFEDEDYIALYLSKCHFFALFVIYSRLFEDIESNTILKQLFLDNLGIYYAVDQSESDLDYIFNNYISEYRNRGTISVGSKAGESGNTIDGELLRLINYKQYNEYILALVGAHEMGGTIGNSSPLYRGTNLITNLTKAYEYGEGVTSLDLYPLFNSSFVYLVSDEIMLASPVGGSAGIDYDGDENKLIPINRGIGYEISFKCRFNLGITLPPTISFGVSAYDINQSSVFLRLAETGITSSNNLFLNNSNTVLKISDKDVWIRGIIYPFDDDNKIGDQLNIGEGNNLRFNDSAEYIVPKIIAANNSDDFLETYLYDIKVRPLSLPFSLGQLGSRNFILNYLRNGSGIPTGELENIITKELLPYNSIYKPIYLT